MSLLSVTEEGLALLVEQAEWRGWLKGMEEAADYLDRRERREMARRIRALIKQKVRDREKASNEPKP